MRAISAAYIDQDAHIMQGLDPAVSFGNIIATIANLTRYSAFEPSTHGDPANSFSTMEDTLFGRSMTPITEWEYYLTTPPGRDEQSKGRTQLDTFLLSELFERNLLGMLDVTTQKLLALLRRDKVDVTDWGSCVMRDLTEGETAPIVCKQISLLPSVGRGTPVWSSRVRFQLPHSPFSWPHYLNGDVTLIRKVLTRLDRWRWDDSLFHIPDALPGTTLSNKVYGNVEAVQFLARRVASWSALYTLAAARLWRAPHARLRRACIEQYDRRKFSVSTDAEAMEREAEAYLESVIPVPPLLSYMENLLSSGRITSQMGEKEQIYFNAQFTPALGPVLERVCADASSVSALAQLYVSALTEVTKALRDPDPCLSRGFGVPFSRHDQYTNATVTSVELAAMLKATPWLVEGMKALASKLGWSTIPADMGLLDANGANFCLTDGIAATESPDRVLAGVTPTISLANRRVMGLRTVVQQSFYPSSQKFWVLPVKGEVDAYNRNELYRRAFIPASMSMGERDAVKMNGMSTFRRLGKSAISSASISSPLIESIIRYWQEFAPGYVSENYGTVAPPEGSNVVQGPWDAYVRGNVPGEAFVQTLSPGMTNALVRGVTQDWLAFQGSQEGSGMMSSDELIFLRRSAGAPFYARTLVASSLPSDEGAYYALNRMGLLLHEEPIRFLGDVLYDNSITMNHDFAELDKLLACAPPRSSVSGATVEEATAQFEGIG